MDSRPSTGATLLPPEEYLILYDFRSKLKEVIVALATFQPPNPHSYLDSTIEEIKRNASQRPQSAKLRSRPSLQQTVGYNGLIENEQNASLLASDPKVREFFNKAVGEQNSTMNRDAWKRYMKQNATLEFQDKEAELDRLWAKIVSAVGSASSPHERKPEEQTLTFEEFVNGLRDLAFLRQIVSFDSSSVAFEVPETYNWELSTKENYRCKEGEACRGDYAHLKDSRHRLSRTLL